MNRILRVFVKESTSIFETTISQQLENDRKKSAMSPVAEREREQQSQHEFSPLVPIIMQKFVIFFENHSMDIPGIFRTTGSLPKVKQLKANLHSKSEIKLGGEYDVPAFASCFKLWLRDLVDGIVPKQYFDAFLKALKNAKELKRVALSLPKHNIDSLEYMCRFLLVVASHQDVNKMSITNLSIVFGPCLIRIPALENEIQQAMKETMKTSEMIKELLENYELIFEKKPPVQLPVLVKGTYHLHRSNSITAKSVSQTAQPVVNRPHTYVDEYSSSSLYHYLYCRSTTPMSPLTTSEKLERDKMISSTVDDYIKGNSNNNQRIQSIKLPKSDSQESFDLATTSGSNLRLNRKRAVLSKREAIRPPTRLAPQPNLSGSVNSEIDVQKTDVTTSHNFGGSIESSVASIIAIRPKAVSLISTHSNNEVSDYISHIPHTSKSVSSKSIASEKKSSNYRNSSVEPQISIGRAESKLSSHTSDSDHKQIRTSSFVGLEAPLRRNLTSNSGDSFADKLSTQKPTTVHQKLDEPLAKREQSERKKSKSDDLLRSISTKKKAKEQRESLDYPPSRPAPPTPLNAIESAKFYTTTSQNSLIDSIPEIEKQLSEKELSKMASLSEEFEGMKKNTTASADKLKLRESQHKRLLSHQYEAKSETLMAKRANSVNAMRKISYKHAHSSNVSNVDHIRVTSNKEVNHMTSSVDIFDSVNGISYLELVQSCNKFPALNELSKEVITQIKSTFKTLNLAIHAKTATPEEEITYKRLKRIIKVWQSQANAGTEMSNSEMAPSTEVSASNASDQALESQSSAHSSQKSSRKHKDIKELHAHDDPSSYENQMARKRILQKMLHEYQLAFEKEHGRPIKSTIDVAPLKNEYAEYKLLRKRLATDKNDF